MILVDTSIWVDHLRSPLAAMIELLRDRRCMMHPFVLGEIALGNLPDWTRRVAQLRALPAAIVFDDDALLTFIAENRLAGSGLGLVDAHLLAAAVRDDLQLWTRDRQLADRADTLGRHWHE